MKMNYRKSLFITLLSVSVLGTATHANVFADQQSEKPGVTQSAKKPAVKAAEPTKQIGKATQKNVTITLNPYVVGRSLNITGSYNGTNAVYLRAEVNGQKKTLVSSKELASGKINYYVGNLTATDKAEIVLFDKNYQEIGRKQVTYTEPVKTVVTLGKYVVGTSSTISGTYNGTNAVYMQAIVNDKKQAFVQSRELASGKINYYVGKLNTGDKAEIVLFDKNYQEIGRQQVTIEGPAQVSMTLDKYIIGRSTNVTGTYNGTDAKFIRAEVNGKKEALVPSKALASGKINYFVGNLKAGDNVVIVLFNNKYEEIGRQAVPFSVNQLFYISGSVITGGSDARLVISVNNQKMTITNQAGVRPGTVGPMNDNFGHAPYFTLQVTGPNGASIYNNTWYGDTRVPSSGVAATFNIPDGSTVSMYHAEGYTRFSTNDNSALRPKTGKNYTYKMENNRLVLTNVVQG